MDLREFFNDIVTFAMPVSNEILITPENKTIKVECMNDSRTIVLKGYSKKTTSAISSPIGMNNLGILKGLLKCPFSVETEIDLVTEEVGKNKRPTELHFKSDTGKVHAVYRFMLPDLIPPQPKFKSPDWDIVMNVDSNKFEDFATIANIFNTMEKRFSVFAKDNSLMFSIGGKNTNLLHGFEYEFATLEEGHSFDEVLFWPLVEFLNVMKLCFANAKKKDVEIKITKLGAMEISCESNAFNWSFILPAKKS